MIGIISFKHIQLHILVYLVSTGIKQEFPCKSEDIVKIILRPRLLVAAFSGKFR